MSKRHVARVAGVLFVWAALAVSFSPPLCAPRREKFAAPLPEATRPRRKRRGNTSLQQQHQEKEEGRISASDFRNFDRTSSPVKAFVGGLTDLFVRLSGRQDQEIGAPVPKADLSAEQLEAGIRQEYTKNYLWTGDINEALYEEDCSFTDPTLSFSGLSTYKRNVGSLQGVLDRLVSNSRSVLYSCELRQEDSCVQTRWRMVGDLRLPWGPTIDVVGRTTFSYDADRGNRILSYDEVWEVEPAEALLQLFKPGRKRKQDDDDGDGDDDGSGPLLPER